MLHAAFGGPGFYDAPYHLRTEAARSNPLSLIDCPKHRSGSDTCSGQPVVECGFDPGWNGYSPYVAALADKIGDHPMLFSLLEVFDSEASNFRPSEAATEENRNHGVVTAAAQIHRVEHRKESLPLVGG
jgi:hypothetical protein